jgi:hypothetical protein
MREEYMAGIHVKFDTQPEEFLGQLTEAAYRVALKGGFKASFIDVELDMQEALRDVIRQYMVACSYCGKTQKCIKAIRHEPFSAEANKLFLEDPLDIPDTNG